MCQRCTGSQASCPEQWNWARLLYGPSHIGNVPSDDHILAHRVRTAMLELADATDKARKAGLQVDFTARFAGYASVPVAVVPGSIHLAEISRTTTRKVVL